MSTKYEDYLAERVLNDGQICTYRMLSRALKVHSNTAKEMLYQFHHEQSTKRPGSVHATYLLSGTKLVRTCPPTNGTNGAYVTGDGDHEMSSSPPIGSSLPHPEEDPAIIKSITLTREEDLERTKARYESITSIHVYSLGPEIIKNLQILSDSNREIRVNFSSEDPVEFGRKYGTIQNPRVTRRTVRRPPMDAGPTTASTKLPTSSTNSSKKSEPFKNIQAEKTMKKETQGEKSHVNERSSNSERDPPSKPPNLKRDQSDIFKSFSKSKPKIKKEEPGGSAGASPAASTVDSSASNIPRDEPMRDESEEEDQTDFVQNHSTTDASQSRKRKADREEALRKMMEEDDDIESERRSEKMEEQNEPEEPRPSEPSSVQDQDSQEAKVTIAGGRRRGRRRVMKKKTTQDDEGFLVTVEEPVWESFSEDDAPAPKAKPAISASSVTKNKKGGKPGQGNIMSFFGKK